MLHCIKSTYQKTNSWVRLNGNYGSKFEVTSGVRQGDNLSPLLNKLVLDSLAKELKSWHCGVKHGDLEMCLLMYADDLVLISKSPEKLQNLLDVLNIWCKKWQMEVNTEKNNIIDFRRSRQSLGTNIFRLGEHLHDTVSKYKYLGFYLDEHMTDMERCTTPSGSAGHSL